MQHEEQLDSLLHPSDRFDLLDYRRRIFDLYRRVRESKSSEKGWHLWRTERDDLFKHHPQSPIPPDERPKFSGIDYFDYSPEVRTLASVSPAEIQHRDVATSGEGTYRLTRFAIAEFEIYGQSRELELYWLEGYAGGLFLPFLDETSGKQTYGSGRYLLDTVKGADLGMKGGILVLDFNFAYNPSCSYDPKWVCPLAPPANHVDFPVEAGEKVGE